MSLHFYAYARKGYEFIDDVASALSTSDTDRVGRMTKCVFRALRKRLSIDDSFRMLSQLPMALKAVYVDGWKLNNEDHIDYKSDFVSDVVKEDANSAWRDFSNKEDAKSVIIAVFKVLGKHIGASDMEHLIPVFPADLVKILDSSLSVKKAS